MYSWRNWEGVGQKCLMNRFLGIGSPLVKTVIPLSGSEGTRDSTSGRVGPQRVTGQPVAFGEHLIDFMNRPLAVARGRTRPEW